MAYVNVRVVTASGADVVVLTTANALEEAVVTVLDIFAEYDAPLLAVDAVWLGAPSGN